MGLNIYDDQGVPLGRQKFTWRELVQKPISKLDDDAFTRVRIILMNGIENEALRFSHAAARINNDLRLPLAAIRRVAHHQATMINWLIGADPSPLETPIAYEQKDSEVTAALARREPDPYIAVVLRFGLLEDFDHMQRYTALLDRLTGMDANNILQCYTDIMPGRPTKFEHRSKRNDLRTPYDRKKAATLTKMHALTITAGEHQTHDYYINIGPLFSDPLARQLYAEISSIEVQHVTQYESLLDPTQTLLEQWLLHEANEVYNYYGCLTQESNPRIQAIWQRMLDYELGHFHMEAKLFKQHERMDPEEIVPAALPDPFPYESNREFVQEVLVREVNLRPDGPDFVDAEKEPEDSLAYREHMNSEGSPSEIVAAGYRWRPGTELNRRATA